MERENKTIEEYKREVFDVMNDDRRLKYMYEMNLEILELREILSNLTKYLEKMLDGNVFDRFVVVKVEDILERIKSEKYERR